MSGCEFGFGYSFPERNQFRHQLGEFITAWMPFPRVDGWKVGIFDLSHLVNSSCRSINQRDNQSASAPYGRGVLLCVNEDSLFLQARSVRMPKPMGRVQRYGRRLASSRIFSRHASAHAPPCDQDKVGTSGQAASNELIVGLFLQRWAEV